MLCKYPFNKDDLVFPCGQCMPCRIRKRSEWTHRLLLESTQHEESAFLTLTYNDDELPEDGSLNPDHTRLWLYRFRKAIRPLRIRFFLVGEYGDENDRPHYHAAVFGFKGCDFGQSRYSNRVVDCCPQCDVVRDTWGKGHVYIGNLTRNSSQYIVGYTTKKLTNANDTYAQLKLKGRHPEYTRMSQGIGRGVCDDIASDLIDYIDDGTLGDVPAFLLHGTKKMPLGRYLRDRIRERVGLEKGSQDTSETEEKVRQLREDFINSPSHQPQLTRFYIQNEIAKEEEGKVARIEQLHRFYSKRKML